jgi:UDP-N-acetylmuramate-alanine ligase
MAGLGAALHARALGLTVTGYDEHLEGEIGAMLSAAGIVAVQTHDPALITAATIVAASKAVTSVTPNHPELATARANGITPWAVQQVIADAAASRGGPLIGVAGTHGKTTSTGWVLEILRASGRDLSAFVGGPLPDQVGTPTHSPVHIGTAPGFIVEADEYSGNFDAYAADAALLLNAEWDHPDIFENRDAVVDAFISWLRPVLQRGCVVINVGDTGGAEVARALLRDLPIGEEHRLITYALGATIQKAHVAAKVHQGPTGAQSLGGVTVTGAHAKHLAAIHRIAGEDLPLALGGAHNAANALGAALLAAAMGATTEGVRAGLARYQGVGRRLEVLYDDGNRTVIDDYGHHPTAIAATIATARVKFPGRPLWLLVEPLTYHRTAALLEPLAQASTTADRVFVMEIHASRDPDLSIASAEGLAQAIQRQGGKATASGNVANSVATVLAELPAHAVLLVMGGGKSTLVAHRVAANLTRPR